MENPRWRRPADEERVEDSRGGRDRVRECTIGKYAPVAPAQAGKTTRQPLIRVVQLPSRPLDLEEIDLGRTILELREIHALHVDEHAGLLDLTTYLTMIFPPSMFMPQA
jgi:hypothetical protein